MSKTIRKRYCDYVRAISIYRMLVIMILAPLLSLSACTSTDNVADQVADSSIVRAVFADKHLWLLSDAGELSVIDESRSTRTVQHLSDAIRDLCVSDGLPMVITQSGAKWSLLRLEHGHWSEQIALPSEGDGFVAVYCKNRTSTILTSRRLLEMDEHGKFRAVPLSGRLHPGAVSAFYDDGKFLFVGINAGEWGGGLVRINRDTGAMMSLEKNDAGSLCGGPLNAQCDPVNGVVAEPWNADCVVAAVGLVHMLRHGRIVEVCGTAIRTLYAKPYVSNGGAFLNGHAPAQQTVAFFGLISSGSELWAVGNDGLYEIGSRSAPIMHALPQFKTIGGLRVSFDNPGVVILMTSENERHSVSGDVPMLIPR